MAETLRSSPRIDCSVGRGDDGQRLGQVEQLHLGRPLAEEPLAQEGVEVDAAELALLVVLAGHLAGLVVGDDQAAVGVELEPVDDAAEAEVADRGLELELDADGRDGGRVLELEVAADELLGVVEERGLGRRRRARARRSRDRRG